jgi:hypothetical protein
MASEQLYLACVKFDLICKEFEKEYHEYFDEHVLEWTEKPGCSHGWRTKEVRRGPNEGFLEQEFWQIYCINDPRLFRPQRTVPAATEKNPWLRDRCNWGRVYYTVLSRIGKAAAPGRFWGRFEFDFKGSAEQEAAFKTDWSKQLAQVAELPGVQRVWQLEFLPHDLAIGPQAAAKYMALYEVDAPECVFDLNTKTERVPLTGGFSQEQLIPVGRHFATVLLDLPSKH